MTKLIIKDIFILLVFTVFAIVVYNIKKSRALARGQKWWGAWGAVLFLVGSVLWYIGYYLIVGHAQ